MNQNNTQAIGLGQHLAYVLSSVIALLLMHTGMRLALLIYNRGQASDTAVSALAEAFFNGLRFDLRLITIACLPLLLAMAVPTLMRSRRWMHIWLTAFAGITLFLGVMELDFYREINQRLNGLVFQYMKEDPKTVLSMIWFGFPVIRLLLVWGLAAWGMTCLFHAIDRKTRPSLAVAAAAERWPLRIALTLLCVVVAAVAARGTLRQGPPLRWGDAFTTESMFANQLGLNGTLTLVAAATNMLSSHRDNAWKPRLPQDEATTVVRQMLLTPNDVLVDADKAAVRRDTTPPVASTLPIRNVVVILFESLAGHSIGALGAQSAITPHFDRMADMGLLFTRFFSNGTHTHQGMFATMACFPNLPAFEYLMQTPEGSHDFSGLPKLLGARKFDNLYVYNGDFAWDNQSGFFGKQGITNFVGRNDYKKPIVSDPTWGVSDQDMFNRAVIELEKKAATGRPFYALLQTLSNHTPYPLPAKLPVEPVTGHGALDDHLTAMRYADWALGQFFDEVRKLPFYRDTLFVVVGDHGFGSGKKPLTELNLARFNVPLLLIGPGIREKFGARRDTVGTQVDVVPTIMGRLGGRYRNQCWGRDLLTLPADDKGFGVIKPSGGEQIVGIVEGDKILIKSRATEPKVYAYRFGREPGVELLEHVPETGGMNRRLEAFLQTATKSLLDNTTGTVTTSPAR